MRIRLAAGHGFPDWSGALRPQCEAWPRERKTFIPYFHFFSPPPSLYDVVKAHEHSYPLPLSSCQLLNMGSNASYPLARLAGVAMHAEEASSSDLERLREGFLPPFFPRWRAWLLIVATCVEKGCRRGPSSFTKLKPSAACRRRTGMRFFFFFPAMPLSSDHPSRKRGKNLKSSSLHSALRPTPPTFSLPPRVWSPANSNVPPSSRLQSTRVC